MYGQPKEPGGSGKFAPCDEKDLRRERIRNKMKKKKQKKKAKKKQGTMENSI